MNEIEFVYPLSADEEDRLRVKAIKTRGRIASFVVQYEAFIQGQWRAIVRYDTAHRFAHKDILHPDGSVDKQPLDFPSLNLAFTFAIQDLKSLWRWYRYGYEKELSR
ncbi:MAG: hypothetical protein HYV00_04420 [Deltaproteobacteria bacterium]|nr:hypothetical protein [Deltaproteobacteria bacterium]